jgi:large subunit ribosomal protein L30
VPESKTGAAKKPTAKKAAKKTSATKKAPSDQGTATEAAAPPAKRSAASTSAAKKLRVKQVRSGIGYSATFRRTLRAVGLKHHQDEVVVRDTPSMQGMLRKVRHLVSVSPEEA